MRSSTSLFAIAVTALLAVSPSSTHGQTIASLFSFSNMNSSGNPAYVVPLQGRDGRLYGTTVGPRAATAPSLPLLQRAEPHSFTHSEATAQIPGAR